MLVPMGRLPSSETKNISPKILTSESGFLFLYEDLLVFWEFHLQVRSLMVIMLTLITLPIL